MEKMLELDGRKLGYRYKALPVNFYHQHSTTDLMKFENEDRILTNDEVIENFDNYVISYDVYFNLCSIHI